MRQFGLVSEQFDNSPAKVYWIPPKSTVIGYNPQNLNEEVYDISAPAPAPAPLPSKEGTDANTKEK
jgi:hypothetical protein